MRIQHNIMAMNAYRNYTNNTSAVSKNLEKLSSGYRINRAGDDAAGLAISEKMRAQITGLSAAQKNVKDGISLVKTAEGATQEIHDMLNRMVYLAEQSSNGTYQDKVDRDAIQDEFNALKKEIDRIADSSNFNGIKLLDGSLAETGKASSSKFEGWNSIKGALAAGVTDVAATKSKDTIVMANMTAGDIKVGEKLTMSITLEDGTVHDFALTTKQDANTAANFVFVDDTGKEFSDTAAKTGNLKDDTIGAAFTKQLNESDLGKTYKFSYASGKITMEAKESGAVSNIKSVDMKYFTPAGVDTAFGGANKVAGPSRATGEFVKGADKYEALDLSKAKIFDDDANHTALEKAVFEINGEKFVFIEKDAVTDDNIAKMREAGIEHWVEVSNTGAIKGADVEAMVEKIKHSTGLDVKQGKVTTATWADKSATVADDETFIKIGDGATTKAGGGLTLQIGDTSDDFNQLTVSIADMHAKALGIDSLDLNTQTGAQAAVQTIKDAINKVSTTRGELGATQNRLEHTSNNLSVMKENIQDAEASIRDTDIAEEMMAYTKNNILVQSAQAMLAQANQVPQGVLQLLG